MLKILIFLIYEDCPIFIGIIRLFIFSNFFVNIGYKLGL